MDRGEERYFAKDAKRIRREKSKPTKLWVGTDALTLVEFPVGKKSWKIRILLRRFYYKLFWRRYKHVVVSQNLRNHLVTFGIPVERIDLKPDPVLYPRKIDKIEHDGINVLYYCPMPKDNWRFKSWVYGYDIFQQLIEQVKDVEWIRISGKQDMTAIFPQIDCYIRPNRHDGNPRLIRECIINQIPYYWSKDGNPRIHDIVRFINGISIEKRYR